MENALNVVTEFTPYAGLLGGALIGLSAIILMAGAGRIAGCSSIFRHLFTLQFDGDFAWRAVFIVGLMLGTAIAAPFALNAQHLAFPSLGVTALSGLLVGFGTTLSRGCTSGHGICGLSRFSLRSFVAVVTFMAASFVTVFVMRHVIGA